MQAVSSKRPARGERKPNQLGRAMRYLLNYPRTAVYATTALLIATLAQLAVPELLQRIIDAIISANVNKLMLNIPEQFRTVAAEQLGIDFATVQTDYNNAPRTMIYAGLIIVLFAVARGLFSFAQAYLSQVLSENIAFDLRNDIYSKIQRLSFSYHDRNQTGQLMIRATDDVERLRIFLGQGLLIALQAFLLLTVTLVLLFFTNIQLTLAVLPILPLAVILFGVFGAIAQPLFAEVQVRLSKVNTVLQENLSGLKVVKSFVSEKREYDKFVGSQDSLVDQRIKISRIFSFLFPVIFLIANLGQGAVLYFGGRQMINGTLTLGEWQKFSLYLVYIFLPMGQLGFIISLMAQASASANRIFEILDAKNEVEDKPNAETLPTIHGNVEFENVTFRYFSGGDPVLKGISLSAKAGQRIALLGGTGSGKTTIINLIPRFYDVSEGSVKIDGHDVRDVTIESLRNRIGIVLQETTLFNGTIRENIAFGRPNASDEEVMDAAKAAAAHDFIVSFPDGYNTMVGERGSTLSGGQKQRIAIARALLLNPQILILDDSTSSVDMNTEELIQNALDKLMEGRTSFVIAQRISTVLSADEIIVLEKGEIVARGSHHTLLENSPVYAEIYHSQLSR